MERIKLFCFPYAGGSTAIYSQWPRFFDRSFITLKPVELAGRGERMQEPLYKDVAGMIGDVFEQIKQELQEGPYAFFGHSMGAMIAYELAQQLKQALYPMPLHVFLSGRGAPHLRRNKKYHLMPDEEFRKELLQLGGISPDFLANRELTELFMPILKNDFRMSETAPCNAVRPLDCDISVFLGKTEDLDEEQRSGWKQHTSGRCTMYEFEGGHFFIHRAGSQLADIMQRTLVANTPQ